MKKVKFISLSIAMLVCFITTAQEKTNNIQKHEDTIHHTKDSLNSVKPTIPTTRIVICAPSNRSLINEPLTILDGVIIDSKQFSKVNPNDIESIKVLKGIDATSIYGNKAINGAIIITTKNDE